MTSTTTITEAAILERIVGSGTTKLDESVARTWLTFRFDASTTQTIRKLLRKNNRGTINAEERIALEKYLRVGQFFDLLHARARVALRAAGKS